MRVVLVTNVPAPYRTPVWEALAEQIGELHVFSCARSESDRVWQVDDFAGQRFTHRFLPGWSLYIERWLLPININPTLPRELHSLRPDAIVITGTQTPSFVATIAYANRARVPLVLLWESHAGSSRIRRGPIGAARTFLVRRADAYATVGTLATRYLLEMGVESERVVEGVNAVDVAAVERVTGQARRDRGGPVRFLYVGQLIELKGVRDLLKAFQAFPDDAAELQIVGYGPLEAELRSYAAAAGMANVSFAGATRTLAETAAFYGAADFLVLPTHRDVWGLVVNEALAAGVPVVVSRQAGATIDLVERAPLPTGITFDARDVEGLRRAMSESIARIAEFDRSAIAAWGRTFTPEALARAMDEAIRVAVVARRRRAM